MDQITRIIQMEQILDDALAALDHPALRTQALEERVRRLEEYYLSPLWRSDYEADCAEKIPPGLKRGILSEDAIYNMLYDWDNP